MAGRCLGWKGKGPLPGRTPAASSLQAWLELSALLWAEWGPTGGHGGHGLCRLSGGQGAQARAGEGRPGAQGAWMGQVQTWESERVGHQASGCLSCAPAWGRRGAGWGRLGAGRETVSCR